MWSIYYRSKRTQILSQSIITFLVLLLFLESPSWVWIAWHARACPGWTQRPTSTRGFDSTSPISAGCINLRWWLTEAGPGTWPQGLNMITKWKTDPPMPWTFIALASTTMSPDRPGWWGAVECEETGALKIWDKKGSPRPLSLTLTPWLLLINCNCKIYSL